MTRRTSWPLRHDVDGRILDEVWERIERARRRRGALFRTWSPVGAAFVVALATAAWWFVPHKGPLHLKDGRPIGELLSSSTAFDDGSYVDVAEAARIVPVDNRATAFAVRLEGGKAIFDVKPYGPRTWTVDLGIARVVVLGTRFSVSRRTDGVRVEVERGRVLVESAGRANVTLSAGQFTEVPSFAPAAAIPSPLPNASSAAPLAALQPPGPTFQASPFAASNVAADRPTSRSRATPHPPIDVDENRTEKSAEPGAVSAEALTAPPATSAAAKPSPTLSELTAAADRARSSGRSDEAARWLELAVATPAASEQRAIAAFTLGKVYLDALGDAHRAAGAFELAMRLGLPRALREDALARDVESMARANGAGAARAVAAAYRLTYPDGRHRAAVDRWSPP